MRRLGWESNQDTKCLREQIEEYVKEIVGGRIPQIPFYGYQQFIQTGSREESEEAYFAVRKQLTAFALYLQWNTKAEKEWTYFNELLWSVSNEFTWSLAAHLPYNKEGFCKDPDKHIDLFAAETAQTLSEILALYPEQINPYIRTQLRNRIEDRIFTPFLEKSWGWETSRNNWCAVCAGSIGMAALLLEQGELKKQLLDKVDQALIYYMECFGEDGASEEGVGYWVYGFGYYTYYLAMRLELDPEYRLSEIAREKIKKIAEFPQLVQMTEHSYIPFSDVSAGVIIPTGLLTYLYKEYNVAVPACLVVTPFDFEHCYRFAHISRNLWWTNSEIFRSSLEDIAVYLPDKQWLIQRKGICFFAVKGGNNNEEHNHNDVGSFIFAIDGELLLADLGAGTYTAEYFSEKRYQYPQTRSYYHNVPVIQGMEQKPSANNCIVKEVIVEAEKVSIIMELSMLYDLPNLQSFSRSISSEVASQTIILEDDFKAKESIELEEGFVSRVKPEIVEAGVIRLQGNKGGLTLSYDDTDLDYAVEERKVSNHNGEQELIYRMGFHTKSIRNTTKIKIRISYQTCG